MSPRDDGLPPLGDASTPLLLRAIAVLTPLASVLPLRQADEASPPGQGAALGAEAADAPVVLRLLTGEGEPASPLTHDGAMARHQPGAHDRHRLRMLLDERDRLLAKLRSTAKARDQAERDRDEVLARLYRAQRSERERLARELHDDVGQQLAGLMLGLKRLRRSSSVVQDMDAFLERVDAISSALRQIVLDLRPNGLSAHGLTLALSSLVREWSDQSGIAIDFQLSGTKVALASTVEVTIFRLVQEALTNVIKHAPRARQVSITLQFGSASVALTIEDDGPGLASGRGAGRRGGETDGFGLLGMRERLAFLGGELVIESPPGRGLTLLARIPIGST